MIPKSGPAPEPLVPQLPPAPTAKAPATGIVAAVGRRVFGWALAHETDAQVVDGKKITPLPPQCSALIKGISDQVIKILLIETKNSSFMQGGTESLQTAIVEVAEHLFITLGESQEGVADDELIERVLLKILKTVKEEFKKPGISVREHFENIAEKLFTDAFAEGESDKRLPKLLRDDWTSRLARFGVAKAAHVDLSWSGIKSLFASYLEQTYLAFTKAGGLELGHDRLPGADAFIDAVVAKVDGAIKSTDSVSLDLPLEDAGTKAFVNRALARLMQGAFTRPEDAQEVEQARSWLLGHVATSIKAIYKALFAPKEGQTATERLNEFFDTLHLRATERLPQTYQSVAEAHGLDKEALAARQEAVFRAVEYIFQSELTAERIQPLLPDFLRAEVVLEKLYGLIASYLADIISQSAVIAHDGKEAREKIANMKNGSKIEGWIDQGISWLWNELQTKAAAGGLDFTDYELTNSLICHMLSHARLSRTPAVKQYLSAQVKDVINIVLKDILNQGVDDSETALALCVNAMLTKGQQAVSALMQVPDDAKTLQAAIDLAQELGDTLKPHELASPQETYDKLYLRKSSREILEGVISQKRFTGLLPEFLKKSNLWQSGAQFLSDNVLKGLYEQARYVQSAPGANFMLPQELKPMLNQLNATVFNKLTALQDSEEAAGDAFAHIASELVKGPAVLGLVQNVLPKLMESALAFHLHETSDQSSEERAAAFVMGFATDMQSGFDRVAAYEKTHDYPSWLQAQDPHALELYRKTHKIAADAPIDVREYMLRETALKLVHRLLPQDLQKVLLPEKFAPLVINQLLVGVCSDYLKKAYDYSQVMTGFETGDADVGGLQKFLVVQLREYFEKVPENERQWTDKVALKIFAAGSEKIMGFLLNFGAIGVVLKNTKNGAEGVGILAFLSPIVAKALDIFEILSNASGSKREEIYAALEIGEKDILAYTEATKKSANDDLAPFAFWVAARKALDAISDDAWTKAVPICSKDKAAGILMKLYETVYVTLDVLHVKQLAAKGQIEAHSGLKAFVDAYFVANFKELLVDLGRSPEALTKTLPAMLDTLLKQCLAEKSAIGDLRDTLVERVVYAAMGKILTDDTPVTAKLGQLIACYKTGDNEACAALLLQTALPQDVEATRLGKVIIQEAAPKGIALLVEDIRKSQATLVARGQAAKAYVDSLDDRNMREFVEKTILESVDRSLEDLAKAEAPLSKEFPVYIDTLLKDVLKDETLKPIIQEALHHAIYIVLQQVFTPKWGQSVQDRVLEVAAELIDLADKPPAMWLKVLMPEAALKELLPEFLQKAITHEKLIEWFFKPYVDQAVQTTQAISAQNAQESSLNVTRAQSFAKKLLAGYTTPTAPPAGLLGFGGVVREIEKKFLEALNKGADQPVAPQIQAYLNATVSQIVTSLEQQGKLDPNFLSRALAFSLPFLDAKVVEPPNMPVEDKFAAQAVEKLLYILMPGGKESLLVPDVLKDVIWQKITTALEGVFCELTCADTRLMWCMDRLIPFTSGDDAAIKARMNEADALRKKMQGTRLDAGSKKEAKVLFKRCLVDAAVYQAGEAVKKEPIPRFFKWIKGIIVRAVTYLACRFSLSHRVYSFIADEQTNQLLCRFVWSLLTYTNQSSGDLKKELQAAFHRTRLIAPIMQGAVASFAASSIADKNITEFM